MSTKPSLSGSKRQPNPMTPKPSILSRLKALADKGGRLPKTIHQVQLVDRDSDTDIVIRFSYRPHRPEFEDVTKFIFESHYEIEALHDDVAGVVAEMNRRIEIWSEPGYITGGSIQPREMADSIKDLKKMLEGAGEPQSKSQRMNP